MRTQSSNYAGRPEVYNGMDVTLTARFAQGGQFSGGLSMGRTVTGCLRPRREAAGVAVRHRRGGQRL